MPIVPFILFVVAAIISSVLKNQKKQQQAQQAQRANQQRSAFPPTRNTSSEGTPTVRTAQPVSKETEAQRRARQEELKRRLEENRARREQEQRRLSEEPRKTLEKRPLVTNIQTARQEKPIAAHEDADCGGGSIHDGYHEGVTQFPNGKAPAVAGRLGSRLADEDERIEREHIAAENARRVMKRISTLPPLAQGMVYSEILGKPKSEIA